jgi:hypothetical protein
VAAVQYTDDRYHWRVELDTRDCPLSTEARGEVERALQPLGGEIKDLPFSDLHVAFIHHSQSNSYHVECNHKLPGATLMADDRDEVP